MTQARIQAFTAREHLESYGSLQQRIDRLTRDLGQARRHAREAAQPAHWQRRIKRLQEEIRKHRRLQGKKQQELESLLARLPREDERQVLSLRYLGLYSYFEISQTLAYSERHIYRLHLSGMNWLDSIIKDLKKAEP